MWCCGKAGHCKSKQRAGGNKDSVYSFYKKNHKLNGLQLHLNGKAECCSGRCHTANVIVRLSLIHIMKLWLFFVWGKKHKNNLSVPYAYFVSPIYAKQTKAVFISDCTWIMLCLYEHRAQLPLLILTNAALKHQQSFTIFFFREHD